MDTKPINKPDYETNRLVHTSIASIEVCFNIATHPTIWSDNQFSIKWTYNDLSFHYCQNLCFLERLEQSSSMSHVLKVQESLQPCWNIKLCGLGLAWIVYDMIHRNKNINPIPPNSTHIHRWEDGEETTLHNAVDPFVDNCFWSLLHAICGWKGYK